MARLFGILRGNRGEVTRTGHSTMYAGVYTWDYGLKIEVVGNTFKVYENGGSNNSSTSKLLFKKELTKED